MLLESSNENSLIVTNVIDTTSKHSAAQLEILFSDSFLSA